jgi:myo-inositol 2-dehydrogenase/D-chiro-inositol 1-dehydrogenase
MQESNLTRRTFVKNSGLVTAGAVLAPYVAQGFTDDKPIRIGVVGCGGRGCGAVGNAMQADPKVELVAIGDLFEDRIKQRSNHLAKICGPRYKVTEENKFTGFDCYKKVIDAGVDYVILASPPVFRPTQLEYAVEKGIHCFYEKPVAVDAPGIRKVIELAKKAKEKNLGFMSGFCWRYNYPKREVFSRVLDGAVGDINAMYSTYNAGEVGGNRGRTGTQSDLEIQMRNWPKHLWLAGDSIVEQAVHSIDMMQWAMGEELPIEAEGSGGRQVYPDDPDRYGNIYDHFAIVYKWANGARGYHFSRQQNGTQGSYELEIFGKNGFCSAKNRHAIMADGQTPWRYSGSNNDMYKTEHEELIASIRSGNPINDGERAANSTMVAIMGRMVAYTGKKLSFQQALNSKEDLTPPHLDFNQPLAVPGVPKPGLTKFI